MHGAHHGVRGSRLHCLSAFSAFPTPSSDVHVSARLWGLHCLSAFSAFPTRRHFSDGRRGYPLVSIAFRRLVRSRQWVRAEDYHSGSPVSIAFRRLVRSRRWDGLGPHPACRGLHCLSAFSAFPTHRPARDRGRQAGRLHCLSAFSAFPTTTSVTTVPRPGAGLHCLSAFSAFPTPPPSRRTPAPASRLHCLSAFSAFPTASVGAARFLADAESPLPFGV